MSDTEVNATQDFSQKRMSRTKSMEQEMTQEQLEMALEKVNQENEHLREQLEQLNTKLNATDSVELGAKINSLEETITEMEGKIMAIKKKHSDTLEDLKDIDEKLMNAKMDLGGITVAKENTQLIEKQIKVLENRLEKALISFNESLAANKELRKVIENLRQERVIFDTIYKKMEKELQKKKKEMAKTIEDTNLAYEERDQVNHKLRNLKQMQDKVITSYDQQFKDLDRMLQMDAELSVRLKQQERERKEKEIFGDTQNLSDSKKQRTMKGTSGNNENKIKPVSNADKIKQFEDMFRKIENSTGMTIDNLIDKFAAAEDENYKLFTYVNELNTEIEKIEEQVLDLEEELEKYQAEGSDTATLKHMADLQENLKELEAKSEHYENKYQSSINFVQQLAQPVQSLFDLVGCDVNVISEMLGTTALTESTLIVFLGMIEQKVSEMVHANAPKDRRSPTADSMGPQIPFGSTRITIDPPSTIGDIDDDEEDDDTEEKPLTREELFQKYKQPSKLFLGGHASQKKKKNK